MENKKKTEAIRLGITAVILMSLLGAFGGMLPFSGILLYIISILFFISAKRYGFIFTLPFLIMSYVIIAFATSFSTAIADVLSPGLSAALMGELLKLNRSQGEILGKGILIGMLCNLSSLIALKLVENVSLIDEMRKSVETVVYSAIDKEELTIYSAQTLKYAYEGMLSMVPSFLISSVIIGTFFIYYMGCALLRRRGEEMPKYFPFASFSFSRNIFWGCILIFVLGYVAGLTGILDTNVLMLNITVITWMVFCIQGLAVMIYLTSILKFSRIFFIIFVCLLIMSIAGTAVLFLVGVLDIMINIRKRIAAKRG